MRPGARALLAAAWCSLAPGSPVAASDGSSGAAAGANAAGYEPYLTAGAAVIRSGGTRFADGEDTGRAALYGSENTFDAGAVGHGLAVDIAAGVRLGPRLRAQLELGAAPALEFRGNTNYRSAGAHQPSEADLGMSRIVLAGFYEFPGRELSPGRDVSPFLGAGAGVSTYRLSGYVQRFPDPDDPGGSLRAGPGGEIPFTAIPDGRGRNRTWMLTVGVSIPIREGICLDLGYRYVDAGVLRTDSGDITIVRYRREGARRQIPVPINETAAELRTHALLATFRFPL